MSVKKLFLVLAGLVAVFLLFVYFSIWSSNDKGQISVIHGVDDIEKMDFTKLDSVTVAASTFYEANFLKETMQGQLYRDAWATPVKVPVLFLDKHLGGLTVLEKGGGKQTHSLDLQAPNGVIYTLRSVNKDPTPIIPDFAKALGLENVVEDGIAAQHPYGALVSSVLADHAKVFHTSPKLYFVPKQKSLDTLNDVYGNRLFLLEYESEGDVNWTQLSNVISILDTKDLIKKIEKTPDLVEIDYVQTVRSRLFDIIIGDWDRHKKQWGWAMQQKGDKLLAVPIAADRDNAFFIIDGVVPTLVSNQLVEPHVRPFDTEIDYLPGIIYPFDDYFLSEVPQEVFISQAKFLQQQLTNEVVDASLRTWPKEIYDLNGPEIAVKIKGRRDLIVDYANEFYLQLKARKINPPEKTIKD